jgi:S-formylglutathione hydrolase FrmB
MNWTKVLIYGSFAAGTALFLTGRRPVGIAVAGIGLATLAAEHPEKFEELWRRAPEYIEKSGKFIDMAATFLDRLSQQQGGGYRNIPAAGGSRY